MMNQARLTATTVCTLIACVTHPRQATAQTTTRISISTGGTQGNNDSGGSSMSANGRVVAFHSGASTLATDTNGVWDVFLRNLQTGTTVLVSIDGGGLQGNSHSDTPAINLDGRYVAFQSDANNLVPGDANGTQDVFLRDMQTGQMTLVSSSAGGVPGNGLSQNAAISSTGRFVAFQSSASSLLPGDTNFSEDIYVKDLSTGSIACVSVDPSGTPGNWHSTFPSISADGRYVAFASRATNLLMSPDTNNADDVFVYDRTNGTMVMASVTIAGVPGNAASRNPRISADGRYVAFESDASSLVTPDTNSRTDIFVRDLVANTTSRISNSHDGSQSNGNSTRPSISSNGRFVAYQTLATNILPGGTVENVFLYDANLGTAERVSVSNGGLLPNAASFAASVSGNGRFVTYTSTATLVTNDSNGRDDVYLTDAAGLDYLAFCFGDGSGTPCPCAQSPVGDESGCINSAGTAGHLEPSGFQSIANDTLVLQGSGMISGTCLYIQGTSMFNSGLGGPYGDGLRCYGGTPTRLGIKSNVAGSSQYPELGDQPIHLKGSCTAGDVRIYQIYYRDPHPYCGIETWNLTNGIALTWRP